MIRQGVNIIMSPIGIRNPNIATAGVTPSFIYLLIFQTTS